MPLFAGGRIHAEIARADLEQTRIAQNRQLLETRIVREVKSAIDEVDAARKNVDVANLGLQLANDEVAGRTPLLCRGHHQRRRCHCAGRTSAQTRTRSTRSIVSISLARAMGEVQNTYAK